MQPGRLKDYKSYEIEKRKQITKIFAQMLQKQHQQ
jgi:hypothetical protein